MGRSEPSRHRHMPFLGRAESVSERLSTVKKG